MATVLKPDHAGTRKHFIFTDEHEQLRESIARFCEKELRPHAEKWEEETFESWVFPRMGELGYLGLSYPEEQKFGMLGSFQTCHETIGTSGISGWFFQKIPPRP